MKVKRKTVEMSHEEYADLLGQCPLPEHKVWLKSTCCSCRHAIASQDGRKPPRC